MNSVILIWPWAQVNNINKECFWQETSFKHMWSPSAVIQKLSPGWSGPFFFFFFFHHHLGWPAREIRFLHSLYVLRFYGLCLTFWIRSHPKFHFMHQQKFQPKGKEFSSYWSGIQEFICLEVWSQAKLCYLGKLPKHRSVLCFESWNH